MSASVCPTLTAPSFPPLQAFKVKAITAYYERLLRLSSPASLRIEMTQFSLSVSAEQPVLAEHRAGAGEMN